MVLLSFLSTYIPASMRMGLSNLVFISVCLPACLSVCAVWLYARVFLC
jgi:hypothetical protein